MDYAAFVTFSEAGDKVARLEEMLDTAFLQDFAPKFGHYLQYHGGPTAVAAGAVGGGKAGVKTVAEVITVEETTAAVH